MFRIILAGFVATLRDVWVVPGLARTRTWPHGSPFPGTGRVGRCIDASFGQFLR